MSIYLQLLVASFLWGTNVIVMKILLKQISFLFLAVLRVLFSFLFLGIYMKYKHIDLCYHYKSKAFWIGFFGIYLNFFFTFLGMNEVKGVDNAFLNALAPVITFIFSVFLLGKKGKTSEYIALFLTIIAFLLSIHLKLKDIKIGFIYLFMGLCLYMLSHVMIQKWQLRQSLSLTFYQLGFGFILLFFHCLIVGQFDVSSLVNVSVFHWFLFLVISGVGFAYIQYVYMKSVEDIGVLKTSSFLSLNPIVTYIESLLILKESFDLLHFIGFVFIVLSVYMINYSSKKNSQKT